MKKNQFRPYKTINEKQIELHWKFLGQDKRELKCDDKYLKYTDDNNDFNYEKNILTISCQLKINNAKDIFGKIIGKETLLGVALRWFSASSKQRQTGEGVNISDSGKDVHELTLSMSIPASTLRGEIEFDIIVFAINNDNSSIVPISGSILFQSEPILLRIDGQGSLFPVFYCDDRNKPLWWVDFNINDPLEDCVNRDVISLNINKTHADFKIVCPNGGDEIEDLVTLKHIYAGVFCQLLVLLRSNPDWWQTVKEYPFDNYAPNTIGALANYGYRNLWGNIDPSEAPNELFQKMLLILDNKLNRE